MQEAFSLRAVSETWLKKSHTNKSVEIPGFKLIRHDRQRKLNAREPIGGGVCLYVRKSLKYKIIICSKANSLTEFLFIEVDLNGRKIAVGVIYRPPNAIGVSDLTDLFSNLISTYSEIVVIGDFNINYLMNYDGLYCC